ncbi:Rtc1p [Sugiyamaella lignohabitans]|uniref:Restriction of telomere capping protein 1 n=1 Tax=Sugiyamaella lignohabitans TaxID=796027 RepID=A0A167EQU9_9ASCO|nr:Rtc1p [Sugiyamaella lignohabitans]ANB14361.1 Rtc1p [Sugiyamaella lignohabitans]
MPGGNSGGEGLSGTGSASGFLKSSSSSSTPAPDRHGMFSMESPPSGGPSGSGSSSGNHTSYANIAAMAIKSGPLARIGKALYSGVSGASSSVPNSIPGSIPASPSFYSGYSDGGKRADTTGGSPASSTSTNIGHYTDMTDDDEDETSLKYTARGGIFAMANSPSKEHVAIVGKDFFQVLNVSNTNVSLSHNVRGGSSATSGNRDFDKTFSATALKWGYQSFDRYIALSNAGGRIFVYDAEKGSIGSGIRRPVSQLLDSTRNIHSLAFNPNQGYNLLSASSDGTVKLWDLRENPKHPALVFVKKGGDPCREVQWSPFEPRRFAAIYDSGVIQRWDLRQPQTYDRRINAHSGAGQSLDWHPEKDYIVSGGRDQQLQVWNMSNDSSRSPDYVIHTPSSVAKVRWLANNNGRNNSIINSGLISCGRSKGDNLLCVWDIKRPYIPINAIERHTDSITDICYRNERYIWSCSKDKTFRQHSLLFEPLLISNLSSSAFTWSSTNDLLFVSQDKDRPSVIGIPISDDTLGSEQSHQHLSNRRPSMNVDMSGSPGSVTGVSNTNNSNSRRSASSQRPRSQLDPVSLSFSPIVCSANFPGNDPNIFKYCAQHYQLVPRPQETIADVCLHNSKVASAVNKLRTGQVWLMLAEAVEDELNRYYSFLMAPQQNQERQEHEEEKKIDNAEQKSHSTKVQILLPPPNLPPPNQDNSLSPVFPETAAGIGRFEKASSSYNNSVTNHQAVARGDPSSSNTQPMTIGGRSKGNTSNDVTVAPNMSFSLTGSHRYSFDTTGSSPDDSYGGIKDSTGASYTHISMLSSSVRRARNYSTSTHISSGTEGGSSSASLGPVQEFPATESVGTSNQTGELDLVGKSIAEWKSRTLDDIKEDVSDSSYVASNNGGVGTPVNSTIGNSSILIPGVRSVVNTERLQNSVSSSKLSAALLGKSSSPGEPSSPVNLSNQSHAHTHGHSLSSATTSQGASNSATGSKMGYMSNASSRNAQQTFKQFVSTQTCPWRTEVLVAKAAEFAMDQGDVQLCAVLAAVFLQNYPRICASHRTAEEWIVSYVGLLKRQGLFVAAASLTKICKFKSVRKIAKNDTTLDTLCHSCHAPLSENAAIVKEKVAKLAQQAAGTDYDEDEDPSAIPVASSIEEIGYYYCQTCKRLLDGCTLCRAPVRGLALVLLECGHKAHPLCLKEWVFQEGMVECPSGCGTSLVR